MTDHLRGLDLQRDDFIENPGTDPDYDGILDEIGVLDGIKDFAGDAIEGVGDFLGDAGDAIGDAVGGLVDGVGDIFSGIF